jgi:hypothetical protein
MTKEKEQPIANQYLAIVDSMFTSIVRPAIIDNPLAQTKEDKLLEICKSNGVCFCEICKTEIPPKEYDENLGVCNNCNARLE